MLLIEVNKQLCTDGLDLVIRSWIPDERLWIEHSLYRLSVLGQLLENQIPPRRSKVEPAGE